MQHTSHRCALQAQDEMAAKQDRKRQQKRLVTRDGMWPTGLSLAIPVPEKERGSGLKQYGCPLTALSRRHHQQVTVFAGGGVWEDRQVIYDPAVVSRLLGPASAGSPYSEKWGERRVRLHDKAA